MRKQQTIPLWLAIVININVIVGAGVFINPAPLTQVAGPLGTLSYLGVTLLILPLVLVIAQLSQLYPHSLGGLYVYSKEEIHPIAGIISGLSYFFGKSISCGILIKTFATYFQHVAPFFATISLFSLALITMTLLCLLNSYGVRFGSIVQIVFVVFKALPIFFVIMMAGLLFNPVHFQGSKEFFTSYPSSLPVALFALLGFESCCAIGSKLQRAEKNLARSIVLSFLITSFIYTFFQLSLFGVVGMDLAHSAIPLSNFAFLIAISYPILGALGGAILNSAVMVSVLGGCYGILFVNSWNGLALAEAFASGKMRFLTWRNRHGMPVIWIAIQGIIASLVIFFDFSVVNLTRAAVLGVVIAYFKSAIALFVSYREKKEVIALPRWVSVLGVCSSLYIAFMAFKDLW